MLVRKLTLLIILFFTISAFVYGQKPKNILIYTDDKPHLLPIIENSLKNFKDKNGNKIFNRVSNLTRILENETDEQLTDDTRNTLVKGGYLSRNFADSTKRRMGANQIVAEQK